MPRYFRKVICIPATCSPNVRYALAQKAQGLEPDGRVILPGVLPWQDYCRRLATWDPVRICVGIYGRFYEGADVLLFPPEWLNRAEQLATTLLNKTRHARAIGIDPAEGGDKTAMAVVDEYGLIELVSKQTPDTSVVTSECLAMMRKHNVAACNVVFDRGGGGKEHADRLRNQGYNVRTVAFGEAASPDPRHGLAGLEDRLVSNEDRYVYKNRRAEMYYELRLLLDPEAERPILETADPRWRGFAIPSKYEELRRQLAVFPLKYDDEGRIYLPPKNKKEANSNAKSLADIIGHSPDESDSLCLAVFGMLHRTVRSRAGVA